MKTTKRKTLLVLASALLAGGMAAGLTSCGGGGSIAYDIDWSVTDEALKGTHISFWTPFGTDIETVLEGIVDEFTEKTGIIVDMESKGGYTALNQAVVLSASTKTYPNVTLAYPDHMASYVNNDTIVRLDYYFENDNDDTYNISDFYSDYMKENQSIEFKDDGTPYTLGVPFNKSTEILTYNKTFFDWAVTRDATIKVPSTWDEVGEVGPKIVDLLTPYFGKHIGSDNNGYAKIEDMPSDVEDLFDLSSVTKDDFRPLSYDSQGNFFITTCRHFGGKYTEYDKDAKKGYLAFNSDEVRTGLSYMQELYKKNAISIPANFGESSYSSNPFKVMKSVMGIGSSAGVKNSVPAGNKFQIDVAPIPYKSADNKCVISQGTNLVMMDTGTNNQRIAAWKLIKFLSKEANGEFAAATGYFPACEAAANSDAYQEFIGQTPKSNADIAAHNTALLYRSTYRPSENGWTMYVDDPFIGSSTIREQVGTAMARLFIDNMTPQQVIDEQYNLLADYVRK